MPLIDHFGIIAPLYDRLLPPRQPGKLIDLANLPVTGALLDAGGGTGRVSQALRGLASHMVVADLSLEMLRQASGKDGLNPVCSHTERLPFPDGFFERILMVDALHHVCSQLQTAGELWRVIKPGGWIIIEEPDVLTFPVKLVALAERMLLMRSHFLKPASIAALFPYTGAQTQIVRDGFIAWVLVQKKEPAV